MQELQWFKFYTNFFDDKRVVYLRSLKDGSDIILFFQMLMSLAAKCNSGGLVWFARHRPYTPKLFSVAFGMDIRTVRRALKELTALGFIRETKDGAIEISDWSIEQYTAPQAKAENEEHDTEEQRKEALRKYYRDTKRRQRMMSKTTQTNVRDMSKTDEEDVQDMSGTNQPIYKDKDKDKDKDKETEKEKEREEEAEEEKEETAKRVVDAFNTACASYPKIKFLSDKQKQAVSDSVENYGFEALELCFAEAEKSDFLKGANKKNWTATFDWLINSENIAKVLNGNYSDRTSKDIYLQGDDDFVSHSYDFDEFVEAALARGFG